MVSLCCCSKGDADTAMVCVTDDAIVDSRQEHEVDAHAVFVLSGPKVGATKVTSKPETLENPQVTAAHIGSESTTDEGQSVEDGMARTFTVDVQPDGRKLGIGIGQKTGRSSIIVAAVNEQGMIPDWNRDHPDKRVCVGCAILAINGETVAQDDRQAALRTVRDALLRPRLQIEVQQ
mmetsp:Transcript_32094/g.75336  ORF Transcript_32094/g.75336 Transcript_32094/m.75336 type:complete len:177 (+) Transcript_32094:95-625(+)